MNDSRNKKEVLALMKSFETGDLSVAQTLISSKKYTEHNLTIRSGKKAFLEHVTFMAENGMKVKIRRIFADRDYVFTHTDYNFPGPRVGFDIFRFDESGIIEHWDNTQEKADPNASGHSMTDGTTDPEPKARTEDTREVVRNFIKTALIKNNLSRIDEFFNDGSFIQHDPLVADGLEALKQALFSMSHAGMPMVFSRIHTILAEKNFALAVVEGSFMGETCLIYDLFRVEKSFIAEHWDTAQIIPHSRSLEGLFPKD